MRDTTPPPPLPPNLSDLLATVVKNLLNVQRFGAILIIGLIIIGLLTSVYSVPAESEAVILRFGQFNRITNPGLNFKLPFGIERKHIVPVRRQLKLEFGFATEENTNPYQYQEISAIRSQEKLMITGDKNAATVEWVVQYHIADSKDYLFQVHEPEETLRDSSESIMREVVGDRSVDEVLTIGRQEIESKALEKLQHLVNQYGLGFHIDQVQLKNVNPPGPVQVSFNKVNKAQQTREEMINVARGQYNRKVPRARGEADRKIAQAQGQATQRINEAEGDAARFTALLKEYRKAPRITRQRLYLEKMAEVMPRLERKVIIDDSTKNLLPLLNLNSPTTSSPTP